MKTLDESEKDLEQALDELDVTTIKKSSVKTKNKFKAAARAHLNQNEKMNIRIDAAELNKIKQYAQTEGLKYQTFVKSVLHKYITGQLVEKK